ncbi:MAG: FtsK/SpoIIIE domain-containing protein, partial [Pseudolysinimonas sp.]
MLPAPVPERITLPSSAPAPPRAPFPWAATLAPVVASLGLWALTRSVYSLVFALLGPMVAVGGIVDGRFARRRASRRETQRSALALDRVVERIAGAQLRERQRLSRLIALPTAPVWDEPFGTPIPVHIATGAVASAVELSGVDPDERAHDRAAEAALDPPDGPVILDASPGVGVVGPPVLAAAVARSVAVQVAARVSPGSSTMTAPAAEGWLQNGPHIVRLVDEAAYSWRRDDGSELTVAWAEHPGELPSGSTEVVVLGSQLAAIAVTQAQALLAVEALAERAIALGVRAPMSGLPDRVLLGDLLSDPLNDPLSDPLSEVAAGAGLSAPIGSGSAGPVLIDLVADGPHALVAGTTGSGKSELLVAWVLGMAHGRSPCEVTFLLIDFKGGAAFAPLAGLPHVVATLSDLDPRLTRRAIESLQAELLRRERLLADRGARSIDELAAGVMARLVIVVDEFAAVVSSSPDLHDVFADLAARGRSLGMHLVLCTQRPAGVVRDAVLANIGLRISLRITDRGESIAMLGDDAAARLPIEPRGRALLALDGGTRALQVALARPGDARRIGDQASAGGSVRPWCDPLPTDLRMTGLAPAESGLAFGRLDLTAEQRQPTAGHDSRRHGHLLVLGAAGSGVTTTLTTLAESARRLSIPVRVLSADPADAWGQLRELCGARFGDHDRPLVIADDLDSLLARFDDDHRHSVIDQLACLLRDGSRSAPALVVGARRVGGQLGSVSALFGSRLVLRQGSRIARDRQEARL